MDPSTFIVNIVRKAVHVLVKRSQEDPDLQIKDDETTNSLCSAIEAILLNGQEELGYRKMLTKFRLGSTRQPYECCFWEYLQYYLPRQLVDMIMNSRIQEKRTPIGCCRVWVRLALNETTLCNFLESMLCDTERTNRFYKSTALLRDADRMEATLGLLRVLTSECVFDLDYVGWELNSWNMSTALSLANVHYVVPTITPLRPHSISDAAARMTSPRRSSVEVLRPPSVSSPDPVAVDPEPANDEDESNTLTEEEPESSSIVPCAEITRPQEQEEPVVEPVVENLSDDIETVIEEPTKCDSVDQTVSDSVDQAVSDSLIPEPVDREEDTIQSVSNDFHTECLMADFPVSSITSAEENIVPPTTDADSIKEQPLSSMQVADELPASPQISHIPVVPVASMSSSAIIAEAVRRGLLVTMPVELSESYMQTLIRAIEEHRRVEREEMLESIYERPHRGFVNSPMLSGDDTSVASSWDRNVPGSSASELAFPTESPPVMLDTDEAPEFNDDDEFTIFPRRRTLENSGEYSSALTASCSVPNLAATNISSVQTHPVEHFRPAATLLETSSLSASWDRSARPSNANNTVRNLESGVSEEDREKLAAIVTTPPSDSLLDRIYANFPRGRRGSASSLIMRIGTGLLHSASRFRSGNSNNSSNGKQESDDDWEIVGDEFVATKNARCLKLLEIYPGAERVPDPSHDFSDTNCERCRGHIIGRLRRLDNYDGRWYCASCHEGVMSFLPRRVIYHWDFTPKPVSNETKVVLTRLFLQPNIDVMKTNPDLYSLCPELREVTRVRRQLAFLWQYVIDCPSGVARDMTRMLIPRERLIGTIPEIHLYSLEDLTLIHRGGALLKLVHHVLKLGLTHVWSCSECQTSRPHYCDRCGERVPLYELDIYHKCLTATCDSVIHRRCFAHHPDDFLCLVCTRKRENNVPLHESYDAIFVE